MADNTRTVHKRNLTAATKADEDKPKANAFNLGRLTFKVRGAERWSGLVGQ